MKCRTFKVNRYDCGMGYSLVALRQKQLLGLFLGMSMYGHLAAQEGSYLQRIQATAERQIAGHVSLANHQDSYSVRWQSPVPKLTETCPLPLRVTLEEQPRMWGPVRVQLTCPGSRQTRGWVRQLQGYVTVQEEFWIASRVIQSGELFDKSMVTKTKGDLAKFTAETAEALVKDLEELAAREAGRRIGSGQPLTVTSWRKKELVTKGQTVDLVLQGDGFEIASTGIALDGGTEGATIRVRTSQGEVVEGIALTTGQVQVVVH